MFPYDGTIFVLKGLSDAENLSLLQKAVYTVYFNSTTLIASVYGDISPLTAESRLMVVIEQALGFTVWGSFVALTLRKWFRY